MAYIVPSKMPAQCNQCTCCQTFALFPPDCKVMRREIENEYERAEWCPLIEIPTGARLVDTSKLVNYRVTGNATVDGEDFGKQTYTMLPVASLSELSAVYEE